MAAKTNKATDLQAEFLTLSNEAARASAQLERGQAEMPITQAFQQLLDTPAERPLVVSLLCLSDTARHSMLHWLLDADAAQNFLESQAMGVTRIYLNSADTVPAAGGLRGRTRRPWRNVEVLAPANVTALWNDARTYQQFCTGGHILIVCGDAQTQITSDDSEMIANLGSAFKVMWPICVGDMPHPTNDADWRSCLLRSSAALLPEFVLSTNATGESGSVLLEKPADPLRKALLFEQRARVLQSAVESLARRQERDSVRLAERRAQLGDTPKHSLRHAASSDKDLASCRERFAEGLAALEKQICLNSDRATQPLGKFSKVSMRHMISQLNVADLDQELSSDSLKLIVNARHLAMVNRRVEHALREELTDSATWIDRQLKQLVSKATEELGEIVAGRPLTFSQLNENQLWSTVENLMAIGKESHIELARKGFFDILTAGRQKVFIIIMLVSLLGRMGLPNLFQSGLAKTGFGIFMAVVMIGSMINAVLVWRREKRSQSEKEMSKIKDTLFGDGCKVIDQVEKGKLQYLREYFREVGKVFDQQTKRAAEEFATQQRLQVEADSRRREANRQSLDVQLKIVNDLGKQVAQLREGAQQLWRTSVEAIRVAASRHHTVSPSAVALSEMGSEADGLTTSVREGAAAGLTMADSPVPAGDDERAPAARLERVPRPDSRSTSRLAERRARRLASQ